MSRTATGRKPIRRTRSQWTLVQSGTIGGAPTDVFERPVHDGWLRAFRSAEPAGWHLSIAWTGHSDRQAKRYPTWDEIAHARDALLDHALEFAMFLPKVEEYVAVHDTTFHLHQHPPVAAPEDGVS